MDVRDSQLRDLAARELSELPIDVTVSDAPEENELAIDVTMSVAPQENEPVIDVTVSDAPAPHDGLLETSGVGDARSDDEGAASPWFVAPAPYEPRVAATIPPPSMESMAAEEAVAAVSEGTLLAASVHGDSDPLARMTVSVDSFPSVGGEPGGPIRAALRPVRRGRAGVALGVLVVTNSALAAGVLGVRAESHRDRVPVAALSAEVSDLHRESAATRAKLDETRTTLDEHAGSIAKTMAAVAATDERLNTNEREAKEHEAREQREISTLSSRMTRTEHRAEVQYSLLEALALIDGVKKPSPVTPSAPKGPIGEPASAAVRAVIDH